MKDDTLYLVHIVECLSRIEQYTADGRDAFLRDSKTQDAVLRNLQTLAESTQRLSTAIKALIPKSVGRELPGFATSSFTTTWASIWPAFGKSSRTVCLT